MTRLLNLLGVITVIAAIVIGLLQLDLPHSGRVAVISVSDLALALKMTLASKDLHVSNATHDRCKSRLDWHVHLQHM